MSKNEKERQKPREDAAQRDRKQSRDQGKARAPLTKNRPVSAMAINAIACDAGWVILYNYALHLLKVKVFKFHYSRHVTGQAGSQDFRSRPTLPYHQNSPFFTNYQVGSDLSGRQLTDGRTDQILPFFIFASSPFSSCSHWIGEGPVIDILALRSLLY